MDRCHSHKHVSMTELVVVGGECGGLTTTNYRPVTLRQEVRTVDPLWSVRRSVNDSVDFILIDGR